MRHLRDQRPVPLTRTFATRLAAPLVAMLLALSATAANAVSGTPAVDGTLAFTARLDIGDGQKACSAALVDPYWLLTATSCFADDPNTSLGIPAGAPTLKTTATVGRTDLTTSGGETRTVVELVAHPSRDAVLARLSRPVTTIAPVSLAATAATPGEKLTVAGYGRTATEWSPLRLHSGTFAVDSVTTETVATTGENGASVCMGDTGGPAVRVAGVVLNRVASDRPEQVLREALEPRFRVLGAIRRDAAVEVVKRTADPGRRASSGASARVRSTLPQTLTSKSARASSATQSSAVCHRLTPALLIKASRRP